MSRATALLVLPLLLHLLPSVEAAEEGKARWIGPTGMLEGWHVRIPVHVKNPLHREVLDAVVSHDLRLADALVEAGWVTSRKGSAPTLESFELDPASVRVVEYQAVAGGSAIDGILVGEVPSRATTGLHDSTRPYHNRTQPDLHVEWVVRGAFPANATRTFFIYVDTLTNGKKDLPAYTETEMAPIDARGWISRGTTLYGTAGLVTLVGLENDTLARVDVYSGTKPIPLSTVDGGPNPVTLHQGTILSFPLGEDGVYIRVVANKPLIATGLPTRGPVGVESPMPPFSGPIPSTNGGLVGTQFIVPNNRIGVVAVMSGDPAVVTTSTGGSASLSSSRSVGAILLRQDGVNVPSYVVSSTAPILLLEWPSSYLAQFPSLYGAPTGSRLVGIPYVGRFCELSSCNPAPPCSPGVMAYSTNSHQGVVVTTVHDHSTSMRGRDLLTNELTFPRDTPHKPSSTGFNLTPGQPRSSVIAPGGSGNALIGAGACPLLIHTVRAADETAFSDKGRLQSWGGSKLYTDKPGITTPVGVSGRVDPATGAARPAGTEFWTYWPVAVVAHHNGTVVEVRGGNAPDLRKSLGQGDMMPVGDVGCPKNCALSPIRIVSNKPVAVLSKMSGSWFAGFNDNVSLPVVPAGKPQFRGYMVSLEPSGASTEPMQGIAAPGKSATYKLLVRNLAKDDAGRPVPDTVELRLEGDTDGWTARLSETSFRLEGGASREVVLQVTPPDDAPEGAKARFNVTASSAGNPRMTDRIQAITVIRASYEVGVWFDREGSPPGKTVTLDPEETKDLKVVVKNLASVPDRVVVRATASSPEWTLRFGDTPAAIVEVPLEAGESRTLTLRLTAPATKAAQTNVEVRATSASDASASAKQDATARVRADVRIALLANETLVEAPPGEVATLRVVFENRGTDRVSIKFNTTGALPAGWDRPVTRQGQYEIDEISGIVPGTQVALDVSIRIPANASRGDRANLHFFVETLPQFVGDPILREAVDLAVLAGALHALTPVDPVSSLSLGFQEQVRAQLSLSNGGNGLETLRVVPTLVPEGAGVVVGDPARVQVGGRGVVELSVSFPAGTPAGTYPVSADVVADDGHVVPWSFNVSVPERRLAALSPQGPLVGIAGVAERIAFEVANTGNVPLRLPPRVLVPEGWDHAWTGPDALLDPGASVLLTLELRAPRDAASQAYSVGVDPTWATAEPIPWDLRTVRLEADASVQQGSVVARLRNQGTGDAYGVEVVLLQGDTAVDRAVLQRLPAEGNATAILAPRPGVAGELRVVVDNGSRYGASPLQVPVLGEADGRDVPTPPLGLGLVAVAAIALARRLRR